MKPNKPKVLISDGSIKIFVTKAKQTVFQKTHMGKWARIEYVSFLQLLKLDKTRVPKSYINKGPNPQLHFICLILWP